MPGVGSRLLQADYDLIHLLHNRHRVKIYRTTASHARQGSGYCQHPSQARNSPDKYVNTVVNQILKVYAACWKIALACVKDYSVHFDIHFKIKYFFGYDISIPGCKIIRVWSRS